MTLGREGTLGLNTVIEGVLKSLREAQHSGDLESAALHEAYKENSVLSRFSVPAFSISELELEVRFAIVGLSEGEESGAETPDLKVDVASPTLKDLAPHQIQVMKLKISPVALGVIEEG